MRCHCLFARYEVLTGFGSGKEGSAMDVHSSLGGMRMKKNKTMIVCFLAPAVFTFVAVFLYPVLRTLIMSFFQVESVTASTSEWTFYGFNNYITMFNSSSWQTSMLNMLKIWLVGGAVVLALSLLFAVILTSGIRFKNFFRAAIYLPNVISAVALATMWIYYIFSKKYGLLNTVLDGLGLDKVNWLGSNMKFWSMLIAFMFGAVGYYMLIFLSGIERIPKDIYEAATIDGAGKLQQFTHITMPLLKSVFKTNITFWSVNTITFFVWSKMFSPVDTEATTIAPVVYLYDIVFGTKGVVHRDAGQGAAVGVTLCLCVVIIYFVFNKLIKDEDIEY